jgi:hypothetical protein
MNECFCLFILPNQKGKEGENMRMIFRLNKRRKLISFLLASNENKPNPNGAILHPVVFPISFLDWMRGNFILTYKIHLRIMSKLNWRRPRKLEKKKEK